MLRVFGAPVDPYRSRRRRPSCPSTVDETNIGSVVEHLDPLKTHSTQPDSHVLEVTDRSPLPFGAAPAVAPDDAPPMQVTTGSWQLGPAAAPKRTLTLTLTNVAAVTVDVAAAALPAGRATITTDGTTTLTLAHLQPGKTVRDNGHVVTADRNGTARLDLSSGTTTISW